MYPVLALSGGTLTWYVARATGVVTLGFLTASVLLGILTSFRWSSPNWPRFVVEFVHRNVSLLVVVFLAIHVVTVVADSFAPIRWIDVVVPFISAYRPFWLGFGAVAFDLLIALVVTSLLRHRLGFTTWRFVHWLAYLCWPVAVLHGLGTGSDTRSGLVLAFTAACVVAVLVAAGLRLGAGLCVRPGGRAFGLGRGGGRPGAARRLVGVGPARRWVGPQGRDTRQRPRRGVGHDQVGHDRGCHRAGHGRGGGASSPVRRRRRRRPARSRRPVSTPPPRARSREGAADATGRWC